MNTIRKQIGYLYTSSVLGNLSLTGAWVAILAARGYSLVEIGFVETVFHVTSIILRYRQEYLRMYLEEKYVDCEQYFTNDCKCCYDRIREFVYDMSVYCTSCDELQFFIRIGRCFSI